MTLDLEFLKALAHNATRGPWRANQSDPYRDQYDSVSAVGGAMVLRTFLTESDAIFIANAREAVPALIAEVERLRAELNAAPASQFTRGEA